jgi:GTPase
MITFDRVRVASTEIQKGEHLAPEVEEGNREYKFKLTDLTDDQLTHRITQLNWRLNEGNDEAFYLIGVEDNGNQLGLNDEDLQESLRNLQFIADQVGCEMMVQQLYAGEQGTTAEVYMRRRERLTVEVVQVNVAVAGDLNSGKSTMIGVLSTGQLDNGKGLARTKVLTHNHEVESGLTSCISHHSLHFSGDGEVSKFLYSVLFAPF